MVPRLILLLAQLARVSEMRRRSRTRRRRRALSEAPKARQWRRRLPAHHCAPLLLLLRIKRLSENAVIPSRASPLSAGYDLSSAVDTKVPARGKALVATDLRVAVPEGTYARIAPRSGLAWKHSIDVGAGVIDADYRGPVGIVLFNFSDVDFKVKRGDRIAQMILERIETPEVAEVDDLDATERGVGGFGSTGI
uniref:Deoxyuridine 5'-triphosphate nucleotidohydrolase n=1 Tax=Ananas comosus var. bracteatus TaxID=296719 RepID=A0A6V7Q2X8_ANACO|nr:unnamed protein product [Ananas comosus var. bracteatus]